VFVRTADGRIVTKIQDITGPWPAEWQATGDFAAAGAPAAILDPVLGRTVVVVRGPDNQIYTLWETAAGSESWGRWEKVVATNDPAATEPTVAPVSNSNGDTFYIVFRSPNDRTRVYERGPAPDTAALVDGQTAGALRPVFKAAELPEPASSN
jgi:hypothetical protein